MPPKLASASSRPGPLSPCPVPLSGTKSDAAPFSGTSKPYVAQGWKPGDKASWEAQLKNRTVQGQNDYVKVP